MRSMELLAYALVSVNQTATAFETCVDGYNHRPLSQTPIDLNPQIDK